MPFMLEAAASKFCPNLFFTTFPASSGYSYPTTM
eukprot:CAMPEP_0184448210 /NCGR_PEP_ID=MMETSP0740-20130409/4230_1 /TAXON_ID=385413 /ORGANISM="Thalassiosira miniscula, Strain CCMP1093" /LENGTH=33 /DNA_ID= /DNA_START= /DNA_END= /DNA_ORIENTATION=